MRLRKWEPADVPHARWVRDVRAVLDRGFRWSEQVGPLLAFRWAGAALDVDARQTARPLAVLCLSATKAADTSATESLCRVQWSWRDGQLRVLSIDTTSPSDAYDVVLGLLTE